MDDWKDKRFVVPPANLGFGHLVVLTDLDYWLQNYELLKDWCQENSAGEVKGMTVDLAGPEELLMFTLKWS